MKVTLVSVAPINADMVQALNAAAQSDPDAIIALTADSGCKPTMLTAQQLGLKVPIMYTGACAAPKIVDSVNGAADGAIFNLEAELDRTQPRQRPVLARSRPGTEPKYGYEPLSAGTVSFRAAVNLYAVLRAIGADHLSRAAILARVPVRAGTIRASSAIRTPATATSSRATRRCARPSRASAASTAGAVVALTGWIDVGAFAG